MPRALPDAFCEGHKNARDTSVAHTKNSMTLVFIAGLLLSRRFASSVASCLTPLKVRR
jgi:hypothetical protein